MTDAPTKPGWRWVKLSGRWEPVEAEVHQYGKPPGVELTFTSQGCGCCAREWSSRRGHVGYEDYTLEWGPELSAPGEDDDD